MHKSACAVFGLLALGACGETPQGGPPTVAFAVSGNDLAQANIKANDFCRSHDRAAQYLGIIETPTGPRAQYACSDLPGVGSGAAGATQSCADALHPERPGGPDYFGPPVPGCTATP